jgi:hypothetical protein
MSAVEGAVVILRDGSIVEDHALAIALGLTVDALLDLCPRPVL